MTVVTAIAPFASASPALARNPVSAPAAFSRPKAIARAQDWVDRSVAYSQHRYRDGYRTDCSGFVSMVWGLERDGKPVSLMTWTLTEVAQPISKGQLQPGDILLNKTSDRHAVVFGGWLDEARTRYRAYEQAGDGGAKSRPTPYPYWSSRSLYRPYRFTGTPRSWRPAPSPAAAPATAAPAPRPRPIEPRRDSRADRDRSPRADRAASVRRSAAVAAIATPPAVFVYQRLVSLLAVG